MDTPKNGPVTFPTPEERAHWWMNNTLQPDAISEGRCLKLIRDYDITLRRAIVYEALERAWDAAYSSDATKMDPMTIEELRQALAKVLHVGCPRCGGLDHTKPHDCGQGVDDE